MNTSTNVPETWHEACEVTSLLSVRASAAVLVTLDVIPVIETDAPEVTSEAIVISIAASEDTSLVIGAVSEADEVTSLEGVRAIDAEEVTSDWITELIAAEEVTSLVTTVEAPLNAMVWPAC